MPFIRKERLRGPNSVSYVEVKFSQLNSLNALISSRFSFISMCARIYSQLDVRMNKNQKTNEIRIYFYEEAWFFPRNRLRASNWNFDWALGILNLN